MTPGSVWDPSEAVRGALFADESIIWSGTPTTTRGLDGQDVRFIIVGLWIAVHSGRSEALPAPRPSPLVGHIQSVLHLSFGILDLLAWNEPSDGSSDHVRATTPHPFAGALAV